MAVAHPDLDGFRHDLAELIGVPVSEVGMLPDQSHLQGGGYHCGRRDLISIGKFHTPELAHIGSATEDYSARQLRDRNALSDYACAVDEPDGWDNGGNAAWIKANNMILAQMQAGDPALAALRAMNFTPDGKVRRRYDTNSRGAGVIASTDTVLWHTHWEFWRDTLGTPGLRRTLARLLVITRAAIQGRPVPPEGEDEDDMGASFGPIDVQPEGRITSLTIPPVRAGAADPRAAWLNFHNDTGQDYGLRIWYNSADEFEGFAPLPGTSGGLLKLRSGQRWSQELPEGTSCLSVLRQAIDEHGNVVSPTADLHAFAGHLTLAIERGPVIKK